MYRPCTSDAHVPKKRKAHHAVCFSDVYWKHPENPAISIFAPGVEFGVPFQPTPFRVTFRVKTGEVEVTREVPIEFRYVRDIYNGDKRMELSVVPAFSVKMTPPLAVIPESSKTVQREIHVSVTNGTKGAAQASVALDLPAGWKAAPASATLAFAHEDESLSARFEITAPAGVKTGEYTLRARVTAGGDQFTTGYQDIEYPHVQRRQVIKPAEIALKVVDVKTAPNLTVGYIVGVGDQVPAAIRNNWARRSPTSSRTNWRGATCRSTTSSSPAFARMSAARICGRTIIACSITPSAVEP